MLTEKKKKSTKSYVLSGRDTEELSLGDNISGISEGLFQKGDGGARIYGVFAKKKKSSWKIKNYAN